MSVVVQNSLKPCGLILLACLAPWRLSVAEATEQRVEANRLVEFTFTSEKVYNDPFNEMELAAVFRTPQGRELRVPAFWAGGRVWKVRYSSAAIGRHTFRTECSDTANGKLHGATGLVEVVPYQGDNPLYRHGPIRVAADHRHFAHADGTPFFWLGDTWWMGLCRRLHWPQDFQTLAADRKQKGFNVVQIVAGLYPDMPAFDPRGANEAGFPWEKDYARIRPEYFDQADRRLQYLADEGFVPCIVGAWGYHLPWLGIERMKKHWRYLVARYGALPVVWCAAGEGTMPFYRSQKPNEDAAFQKQGWTAVIRSIRSTDPFGRIITIHPSGSARDTVTDPAVLDFDMHQTGHGPESIAAGMARQIQASYDVQPAMPVIAGESSYDGLDLREWGGGVLSSAASRQMFWTGLMHNGAAGGTYGANGIWQVNRRDAPYGPSPHGRSWGSIPWDESMKRAGSTQVALAKKLLMQYEWWRFVPHAEWAAFADAPALALDGCQWIWYPEGNPAHDAPVEKRFFRRTFVIPEGKMIAQARLRVSADDAFELSVNGEALGGVDNWRIGKQFDLARRLKAGTNVLAIAAENKPAAVPANPAGLIACLEICFSDGGTLRLSSDAQWRCVKAAAPGWNSTGFDDTAWAKALTVARYGDPPWGAIGRQSSDVAPQAAGIPGGTRLIYVPKAAPISVRNLVPQATCRGVYFDPASGTTTGLGEVRADAAGAWACRPPVGCDHDWVIILEPGAR